jgi:hypothetical protein
VTDVTQVIATGSTAIVGIVVGAGLTYGFGALTRRHQEAREDKTRWYEARFRAYADFTQACGDIAAIFFGKVWGDERLAQVTARLSLSFGQIQFVGSQDVERLASDAFRLLLGAIRSETFDESNKMKLNSTMAEFRLLARKDLGD